MLVLLSGIFFQNSFAQLSGVKTIPGDYATISAAITALNSSGVGSGGVYFNVAAGYTETASALIITATGTSANPIVFQKSGTGSNPVITSGAGVGTMDGIILLSGADYVTFDGFDLKDAATNTTTTTQMEWGFALLKVDGTNGSQYNTIKNCSITLQKTNTASVGIYCANHTTAATTTLTVTATTGSNSGNQFYSNTIQNVYSGITMNGYSDATPYAFYDHYNQIGVLGGNTIRWFGGSTTTSYGIYTIYQDSLAVSNNSIGGGSGGTSTNYGIMLSTSTNSSVLVYNNTVSDTTATTTSTTYGIALSNYGVTGTDNTVVVKRNTVTGMTGTALTSGALYGFYIYYTTAMNLYVDSNKFMNNKWGQGTTTNTGTMYGFYIYPYTTAPTAGSYEYITNNYIGGNLRRQSAAGAGTYYGMYVYYSQANVNYSNNTFENDTLTTSGITYSLYFYNYYATTANYYNNVIRNIYKTGTSTGTFYGFYMSNAAYSGTVNFYNNSVYNIRSGSTSSLYGMYNSSSAITKNCYGNSVYGLYAISTGSVYGMYQSSGTTVNLYRNNIYDLRASAGNVYGMYIASGTTNYIYNNFVSDLRSDSLSSTLAVSGIYLSGGTTDNVYNNTVYLNAVSGAGALFGTAALYASTTPTVDLRNNVLINKSTPGMSGSYTVAYQRSSATLSTYSSTSNYNCLYAGAPDSNHLVYYDGTPIKTIMDYKFFMTPRETFSVTENPPFVNVTTRPYDLRINPVTATQLESGGSTITTPAITTDFDGQARYPNSGYPVNPSYPPTSPDMGADEFGGIPLDATPPLIIYYPLWHTTATTARTLTATITDPHAVPTIGTGLPVLYWKINSGTYMAATGVSIGSGQYTFTFGAGVITNDTVSYFVCAQDTLLNVGSYPFSGASGYSPNPPSVSVPPINPSKYVIASAGLAGDYTVGTATFNKITGRNITFQKVVTKVMKEVFVEDPVMKKMPSKGDKTESETSALPNPKGRMVMKEVEEVKWVPMENGRVYDGPLYIKKSESPNFKYPEGINGIYVTLTSAVADLNVRGVLGATRFLLTDTAYGTGETFPLYVNILNTATKPTSTNTITFKPNTGVNARIFGTANGTYLFRSVESYVTIDGSNTTGGTTRNLTMQNLSTIAPQVVNFGSIGTTPIVNVGLKNTNIINGTTTSSAVVIRDSSGVAGYFNNVTFTNNNLQQAYMGFYLNAFVLAGNGTGTLISGNDLNTTALPVRLCKVYVQGVDGATITNNNIGNDSNGVDASNITGIWLATGTINTVISGNNIGNIYGYGPPRGIAVSSAVANANVTITGNNIYNLKTAYSGPPYGIYVFSTTSFVSVTKNKVTGLLNTNTGGYGARGINIAVSTTPAGIEVINNFVSNIMCSSDASSTYFNVGIGIDGTMSGVSVYNNSVNLFGIYAGYTSATVSTAIYISSGVSSLNLRNNSLANTYNNINGAIDKSYAIYTAGTSTGFADINNNDYYAADSAGILGYLGAAITTLDAWKTATGKDTYSVSGIPQYTDSTNLHVNPNVFSVLGNAGVSITTVTDDIDGNTRSTLLPDIGADEFQAVAPVLLSPANNSTGNPLSLNLVWSRPAGSTGNFGLMVATNPYFTTPLINDTTLTDTTYALSNLNPYTTYYWKVNTKFTSWGSYSNISQFKTIGTATQVLLSTPANNAVGQPVSIMFKWFKAVDMTEKKTSKNTNVKGDRNQVTSPLVVSGYWFEYGTDSTFATILGSDTTLTDTLKAISGLTNGLKYYWRVKAKNQIGWGAFSSPFNFMTVLTAPVLVTPANGSTGVSLTPTLDWNDVTNAASYQVQVSTDSLFATSQFDTTGVTVSQLTVPAGKLSQTTKYYWRVSPYNAGGQGPWSSTWNFTTLQLQLSLNLKVYLEGFWDGSTHVSDTVKIYLANATTPHAFVDTAKVLISGTGTSSPTFSRATGGNYYIVIQHRNHLQTWSATAQTFVPGTPLSYDFTTAATQAYGSNMKQVGTAWVLYGGDPNIDGSIDAIDIGIFVGQFGTQGYLSCDFNGDGDVNASDVQIIAANFGLTVAVPSVPPPGPDNSWRKKVNVNDVKMIIKKTETNKNNKKNSNNQ